MVSTTALRQKAQKSSQQKAGEAPQTPTVPFELGDAVEVIKGAAKGLRSTVMAINPKLAHSVELEPGKGRYKPNFLQKVSAGEVVAEAAIAQERKKERKPPRLPDWTIGTRVACWEHNTFARVEARTSNRIALRWEHGDRGGGTYTAEDLRDKRIARAAIQNPAAVEEVAVESEGKSNFSVGDLVCLSHRPIAA